MKTLATDPNCYLVELSDFGRKPMPARVEEHLAVFRQLESWARKYLSRPHPELGRGGPVCPFSHPSMTRGFFYLTVCEGSKATGLSQQSIAALLLKYRDWFSQLEPLSGPDALLKTILVVFPDLPDDEVEELIEGTQEMLTVEYVTCGLMIGEFHSGPPRKTGLWNPDFQPLESPVPMLVIRSMVPTDFPFLRRSRDLMAPYLERYGGEIPPHIYPEVAAVAQQLDLPAPVMARPNRPKPSARELF